MKWEDLQTSENVEDRRGEPGGGVFGGGPSVGAGGIGLGTMVVLGIIGWALGINPALLIGGADMLSKMGGRGQVVREEAPRETAKPNDQMGVFVSKVLGSNEEVWSQVLPQQEGIEWRAAAPRALRRRDQLALRNGAVGDGPVLLSDRPAHLSRHVLLPRHEAAFRRRRGFRLCLRHLA